MKYRSTLTLLFFFIIGITIHAQRAIKESDFSKKRILSFDTRLSNDLRADKDTLFNTVFFDDCSQEELGTTGVQEQWGTVSGMNGYGDREKAQRLTSNSFSTYQVNWVVLFFAFAEGDDGDVYIRIYEADSNGAPSKEVGSQVIKVSDIQINDTVAVPTLIMFESPPLVTTNEFFVSVDFEVLYESETTEVALLNTVDGCGDGTDTWEQWSDDSWVSYKDAWDFDTDLLVIAEVEEAETSSIDEIFTTNSQAFPSPASDQVNIEYNLNEKKDIQLQVYSIDGQLVYNQYYPDQIPGQRTQTIELQDWNSGLYVYHIRTDRQQSTGKIIVK